MSPMLHFKQVAVYVDGQRLTGYEPTYAQLLATGPLCRCGARNTARIGDSALTRQCQSCGQTYAYRLKDGILVPLSLETALALEGAK